MIIVFPDLDLVDISDDIQLMDEMLNDQKKAPEIFHPTNWWTRYQDTIIEELRTKGLSGARGRIKSSLEGFGVVDYEPYEHFITQNHWVHLKPLEWYIRFKIKLNKLIGIDENLKRYNKARKYGIKNNAKPLELLADSLIGSPNDVFKVGSNHYTTILLNKYMEYAYSCRFIDFDKINTILEIGSGNGRQIEIIKKLHPHICFYVLDIAPQHYVCERYLSSVFPNDVISYHDTKKMSDFTPKSGKIFIIPNWKLPELQFDYDLFWNSKSLEETETRVAKMYLDNVNKHAKNIYLGMAKGGSWKYTETKVGIEQVKTMLPNFKLVDESRFKETVQIFPLNRNRFTFWKRYL